MDDVDPAAVDLGRGGAFRLAGRFLLGVERDYEQKGQVGHQARNESSHGPAVSHKRPAAAMVPHRVQRPPEGGHYGASSALAFRPSQSPAPPSLSLRDLELEPKLLLECGEHRRKYARLIGRRGQLARSREFEVDVEGAGQPGPVDDPSADGRLNAHPDGADRIAADEDVR